MSEDRFWLRRHGNGWISIVHRFQDLPFSAGGVHQFGAITHKGIRNLAQAQARADAEVQDQAPHDCAAEQCGLWPKERSGLLS